MFRFLKRTIGPASTSLLFVLSACTGGGPSVPPVSGQNAPAFQAFATHAALSAVGVQANTPTCPTKYYNCYTFSLSKGLKIGWCYGPSSDRCGSTKDYNWSGNVCLAKARRCKPIEALKAKWTGPFKCTRKICGSRGTYELDTITKGAQPPKITQQYAYKQQIKVCAASCARYYIGINVGK